LTADADARQVPAAEGRGEVRDRGSRFFGVAARAVTSAAAEAFLAALRRDHHDATHVAFAWKIGAGRRASDAGEPAGTAGRPIAGAIDASGLTEVVAAVVRYYGGTKLGTGGLARAYRLAAERALLAAGAETLYDTVRVAVCCAFENTGAVRRLLDPPHVRLVSERFEPEPVLELEVRTSRMAGVMEALRSFGPKILP
jgi:putative IMPACT (imprinted ancient) family translation regulator